MSKNTNVLDINDFAISGDQLSESTGNVRTSLLSMDIGLSGGIPEGSYVLISGAPKIGKTTFSLYFAAQCQKVDPEKKVFFFDCEGRLRPELLNSIENIDLNRFFVIKSNTTKILSAENFLNLIISTLKDNPGCICILDSIASLAPEAELSGMIGDSVKMASTASLMYKVYRHISQVLPVTQSTFIGLTHMVANPNPGPGRKSFAVGGNAIKYQASVHLEAGWKQDIKHGEEIIGQKAMMRIIASALGPPGATVEVPIIYGKGVDKYHDVFAVGLEFGLITKAGAWYEIEGNKIQGTVKCVEFLKENKEFTDNLEQKIRDMVFGTQDANSID